jgi:beta-lactamase class A
MGRTSKVAWTRGRVVIMLSVVSVGAVLAAVTIGAGRPAVNAAEPVAASTASSTPPTTTKAKPIKTGNPKPTTKPPGTTPGQLLAAAIEPAVAPLTGDLSVGVIDQTTGVTATYNGRETYTTASIVKADILAVLLLRAQQQGISLTSGQQQAAAKMIETSDNDSATVLWDDVGSAAGMSKGNTALGLTATVPGTNDFWGLTTTTVADQLTLMSALTTSKSPLSQASRSYALGLMRNIESDQMWGVSDAADPGTTPALKNGWLPVDEDNDLWAVNSIGQVSHAGHDYLIVILQSSQPDENSGIVQATAAAKAAVAAFSQ